MPDLAERVEILVAWDELRQRTRDDGDAVALSPAFRETLDRHAVLMKQIAMFRGKPKVFERLLAERAGIGEHEFTELGELHARAGTYLRSVKARTPHTARQDAPREETGIVEAIATETAAPAAEPPIEEHAQGRPIEPGTPDRRHDAQPSWEALYDRLVRDWNDLVAVANRADLPLPLVRGYLELISHVRELANHSELPPAEREELTGLFDYDRSETAVRRTVHDYLVAAERHVKAYEPLHHEAERLDVNIAEVLGWSGWRKQARRLVEAGRAILADEDTHRVYLDAVAAGKPRARLTVDQLRDRIEDGRAEAAKAEQPEPRREPAPKQEEGIAYTSRTCASLYGLRSIVVRRSKT